MKQLFCNYCEQPSELVDGTVIYPHRTDLARKMFWRCKPCKAWVGCHPPSQGHDGTAPLGRLANAELRRAKIAAHAAFDPLWRNGGELSRAAAYKWLAEALGVSRRKTHIGMFDVPACRAVVEAVRQRAAGGHPAGLLAGAVEAGHGAEKAQEGPKTAAGGPEPTPTGPDNPNGRQTAVFPAVGAAFAGALAAAGKGAA